MLSKKLNTLAFWLSATLLTLLPFHAFLWTWFHSFHWQQDWSIIVQAWKEILVGLLCVLALTKFITVLLEKPRPVLRSAAKDGSDQISPFRKGGYRGIQEGLGKTWKQKSFWLGFAFVLLALLYTLLGHENLSQTILGLRVLILFPVAFLAISFFDFSQKQVSQLKNIVLTTGGIVILFALLQKFILPPDFLLHFGYSANISSWLPGGNLPAYHLVEGREQLIRLQSTFAGPNQLGAYLLIILPLAVAKLWQKFQKGAKPAEALAKAGLRGVTFLSLLTLGGVLTLIFTYSRSAWLGGLCILATFAIHQWRKNLAKKIKQRLVAGAIIGAVALTLLAVLQPNFRDIFLRHSSTLAHLERSQEALQLVIENPTGIGLGKTGGVSQRFENSITPENTYLGIALELGWIGGALFLALLITLLVELRRTKNPLFYSLLGVMTIMLFLHPLEDTPTALTLFLLVGMSSKSAKIEA